MTGISGKDLYDEWKDYITKKYQGVEVVTYDKKDMGLLLTTEGTTNLHPVWSPSSKKFEREKTDTTGRIEKQQGRR